MWEIPAARCYASLTWQDIAQMPHKERTVLLQPMGAIEQHGYHLPLAVDGAIAHGVVCRAVAGVAPEISAYVLPPLFYGKSTEHLGFAGTISLRTETLLALLMDVGASVYRAGFRKLALVNAHGGQPQVLELVARDLHSQYRDFWVFPLFVWRAGDAARDLLTPQEYAQGIHGGDGETSLMLALHPELVHLERAVAEYPTLPDSCLSLEGAHPFSWLTADFSVSGTIGDPTPATAARGQHILDDLVQGWQQVVTDLYHFQGLG